MARILSDKPCRITFQDNIAGGSITLEYKLPSAEDRIKYSNSLISRHGKKIESTMGETRMKFGAKILSGIADGEFQKEDGKPLSSKQDSPNYDAEWKSFIEKYAPDVIAMLAMHVFENALTIGEVEEEDPT
ncbi:MAG: hypothetical protein WC374_04200 [Phycisphaerae bacterium]|jgi:hypothetical protein